MSKSINVNPDHYKVAGRERQGEDIVHERQKAVLSKGRERATAAGDRGARRKAQRRVKRGGR
ncbi:MAG: hypothetical protein ACRD09_12730 [Vicinamibacterales bacterium]